MRAAYVGVALAAMAVSSPSLAQQHHHPPQDEAIHEKFYRTWHMPDRPLRMCCNKRDCYPTEVRIVDGDIFAKRREDGKFIQIPVAKVERMDNPDGRNHICAPPPTATVYPPDTVFCFTLGTGM